MYRDQGHEWWTKLMRDKAADNLEDWRWSWIKSGIRELTIWKLGDEDEHNQELGNYNLEDGKWWWTQSGVRERQSGRWEMRVNKIGNQGAYNLENGRWGCIKSGIRESLINMQISRKRSIKDTYQRRVELFLVIHSCVLVMESYLWIP